MTTRATRRVTTKTPARQKTPTPPSTTLQWELVVALAPVFAAEFFSSGSAWTDYDDLTESLWRMARTMAGDA